MVKPSPWQNGVAERLVGSIRRELLDHVVAANDNHLRRLLRDYQDSEKMTGKNMSLRPHRQSRFLFWRRTALRLITAVVMHATVLWSDRSYLDMTLPLPRSTQKERVAVA